MEEEEVELLLANTEDRKILQHIFAEGIFTDTVANLFKMIEVTPLGILVARCEYVQKAFEFIQPLKTRFLYYSKTPNDEIVAFGSQSISNHSDTPAMNYRQIVRDVLDRGKTMETCFHEKNMLGMFRDVVDIGPIHDVRKEYTMSVCSTFFMTDLEIDKQFFHTSHQFSKSMMHRFRTNTVDDIVKTWKEFGVSKNLTEEYVMQLFQMADYHDNNSKILLWIREVWKKYMNGPLSSIQNNQKVGECFVNWFESKKMEDEYISTFKKLKQFLFCQTEQEMLSLEKQKRKQGSKKLENKKMSEKLKKLEEREKKRKAYIAQLEQQLKRMRQDKKNDPDRPKTCKKCKKAAGVCAKRGEPGHLPLLSRG